MTVIKAEIVEAGWIVDGYNLARGVTAGTNLQALIGKPCETCGGHGWDHEGGHGNCPVCAGTGQAYIALRVAGMVTFGEPPQGAGYGFVTVRVIPEQIVQQDDGRYLITGTQVDR